MSIELEDKLQELNDIISIKHSSYHIFTSRLSSFTTRLPKPLKLNPNRNYEIGLQYFSTSNSLTNITEKNNKFIYSTDSGKTWNTITLESGAYEIHQLSSEIKRQMALKNHYDNSKTPAVYYIEFGIIVSTFKSFINITKSEYQVDFTKPNTIGTMLGFNNKILQPGYNISDNTVQITTTSSILIHCDLVSGSYINGHEDNIIYSFPAYTVPVGAKLNIIPPNMFYLPLNRKIISSITFKITDEDGNPLDFKDEEISLAIHLKQI